MRDAIKFMETLVGPVTVAMLLRTCRNDKEMTLEEMAKKLKTTKGYVSNVLTGKKKLSLKKTLEFATVLGEPKDLYAIIWFEEQAREAGLDFKKVRKLLAG